MLLGISLTLRNRLVRTRMPGGVRGRGLAAPFYSIPTRAKPCYNTRDGLSPTMRKRVLLLAPVPGSFAGRSGKRGPQTGPDGHGNDLGVRPADALRPFQRLSAGHHEADPHPVGGA